MSDLKLSAVEEILSTLARCSSLREGWVIDDRFNHVVMKVVSKDDLKVAWSTLEEVFPSGFEEASLSEASKEVRHLVNQMGGLRDDQYLFVKENGSGLLAFTAIWPWQNAPQASLRLGFSGVDRLEASVFERLLVDS